jgi:hypothetical protein
MNSVTIPITLPYSSTQHKYYARCVKYITNRHFFPDFSSAVGVDVDTNVDVDVNGLFSGLADAVDGVDGTAGGVLGTAGDLVGGK